MENNTEFSEIPAAATAITIKKEATIDNANAASCSGAAAAAAIKKSLKRPKIPAIRPDVSIFKKKCVLN